MKKEALLAGLVVLSISLYGCGSKSEKPANATAPQTNTQQQAAQPKEDAGKEALVKYLEAVQPAQEANAEFVKQINDLNNNPEYDKLTDAQKAEKLKTGLLPKAKEVQEKLKAITPDKELSAMHEKRIKMADKNVIGVTEIITAFESEDMAKIVAADDLLKEAQELNKQANSELQDMTKKYNVDMSKKGN
ncbi:hypothetical protein DFP93_1355 [Aneurinibacillus soli]|uniref:Uncharacterized protein n=1 Tax=Aneurinibacillus soli TaxID=1500254 RepID=A0A0U5B0K7_9BACL|nr:hypothetical protein [Aneurinibacillus soli]PYE57059.1 hypothetical protein DFP93_1355 [Aneurinibacillus soli]BAU29493.1 hypothetical protein CB4_03693 [Aneurinibacillus soli]